MRNAHHKELKALEDEKEEAVDDPQRQHTTPVVEEEEEEVPPLRINLPSKINRCNRCIVINNEYSTLEMLQDQSLNQYLVKINEPSSGPIPPNQAAR